MIMLKKVLYSLLLMGFSASAVHAEDANPKDESPFLAVPRLEAKPRIDGEMAEGEWANAAKLGGFMGATGQWGGQVTPMGSEIFLGHDGERFYMAARMQLPPGVTPSMNYRRRDEPVFMDSYQIELWLTPPTEDRLVSYQMIGNAYGAIFDNRQIKDLGVTDVNWDGNWTFKNSYKPGEVWTAELSIPFADLGVDEIDPQQLWRGLVGVAWPQRSWPYPYGFYANTGEHARLSMAETGSTVRIDDLSSLFENRLAPEMTLVNGAAEAAEFHVTASVGDVTHQDRITVPALTSLPYRFERELPEFPEGVKRQTMTLRVNGPDDQRLLAGDWHYQRVEQEELKPEPVEVKPWAMRTRVQFAPLSMGIKAWADLLAYPKRDQLDEVRFVVRAEGGNEAVIEKVVDDFSYDSAETYLWLPDNLEHGEYEVVTRFVDAEGEVLDEKADGFTHENLKERFVWLGTEVGEDIEVREPFEPVRVNDDGRELAVWGRTMRMEGALPSQITSKGAAMLARPIQLVAEVDGERVVAEMVEPIRVTETSDERATFTGTYKLAGLRLELEGVLEFDGMMLYELDAQPIEGETGEDIDRLFISMPVKAENAKYYFSTIGGWNPRYGATQAKDDTGLVWDSSDAADFVPYVFLSDDERALHWFADQDHAWVLGDDAPCARVVRDDEVVELQVNLVRKSGEVPAFAAQFGFIASPVRPILPHWRHTSLNGNPLADSKVNFFFGPGHGGTPIDLHDTETLVEVLEQALDVEMQEGDPNRVLAALPDEATDLRSIPPQKLRDAVPEKGRNNLGPLLSWLHHDDPNLTISCYFYNAKMYFEGNRSEAFRTFFPGEWQLNPPSGWFHLTPTESYRDFWAFHLDLWFKHWIVPGLYFDEVYLGPDKNVFNGNGQLMADGSIRPSFPLLKQRAYLQRMRQLYFDNDREPFIWTHTTDFMAPHAISGTEIAMFGENRTPTPSTDIIDTIPSMLFRTVGRSQKFGFVPVWMTMIGRGGSSLALGGRQTFGWCWMHDVVPEYHTTIRGRHLVGLRAGWGIDAEDVSFIPFWDHGDTFRTDDENFIVSAWTRPDGRTLVQVMNLHYTEDGVNTTRLALDPKALGLNSGFTVYDLESTPLAKQWLEVTRKIDAMHAEDPRHPDASKLGQDWQDIADRIEYDVEQMEVLTRENELDLEVQPRNFRMLVIEPAAK